MTVKPSLVFLNLHFIHVCIKFFFTKKIQQKKLITFFSFTLTWLQNKTKIVNTIIWKGTRMWPNPVATKTILKNFFFSCVFVYWCLIWSKCQTTRLKLNLNNIEFNVMSHIWESKQHVPVYDLFVFATCMYPLSSGVSEEVFFFWILWFNVDLYFFDWFEWNTEKVLVYRF